MYEVDTYSWTLIIRLREYKFRDLISQIMNKKEFMITHEVHKELLHFHPKEKTFLQTVIIFPTINQVYDKYIKKGFDPADASLLEYSEIRGIVLITEDEPMLLEHIMSGTIKVIHLIDYFGLKMIEGTISFNELYQIVKTFRKWKKLTKKKEKKILNLKNLLK